MARRKKTSSAENHERWLVSYADFITLLFAFFVVMFASAQTDKGRAEQIAHAVKQAFEEHHMSALVAAVLGGAVDQTGKGSAQMQGPGGTEKDDGERQVNQPHGPELASLLPSLEILRKELGDEIGGGKIKLNMTSRGLVISFAQTAVFPSGDADVSPDAYAGLSKIAQAIKKIPNPVRLEGHTDSRPINTPRFRSNWDLSAARSIALLDILTDRFGVPRSRLSIAGYADTAPVASNDTVEGRGRNRRVDLVILNERGMQGEPEKYAGDPLNIESTGSGQPGPEPPSSIASPADAAPEGRSSPAASFPSAGLPSLPSYGPPSRPASERNSGPASASSPGSAAGPIAQSVQPAPPPRVTAPQVR